MQKWRVLRLTKWDEQHSKSLYDTSVKGCHNITIKSIEFERGATFSSYIYAHWIVSHIDIIELDGAMQNERAHKKLQMKSCSIFSGARLTLDMSRTSPSSWKMNSLKIQRHGISQICSKSSIIQWNVLLCTGSSQALITSSHYVWGFKRLMPVSMLLNIE